MLIKGTPAAVIGHVEAPDAEEKRLAARKVRRLEKAVQLYLNVAVCLFTSRVAVAVYRE